MPGSEQCGLGTCNRACDGSRRNLTVVLSHAFELLRSSSENRARGHGTSQLERSFRAGELSLVRNDYQIAILRRMNAEPLLLS